MTRNAILLAKKLEAQQSSLQMCSKYGKRLPRLGYVRHWFRKQSHNFVRGFVKYIEQSSEIAIQKFFSLLELRAAERPLGNVNKAKKLFAAVDKSIQLISKISAPQHITENFAKTLLRTLQLVLLRVKRPFDLPFVRSQCEIDSLPMTGVLLYVTFDHLSNRHFRSPQCETAGDQCLKIKNGVSPRITAGFTCNFSRFAPDYRKNESNCDHHNCNPFQSFPVPLRSHFTPQHAPADNQKLIPSRLQWERAA